MKLAPGKPKLGDFIRKIDYLGVKPKEEYKNVKEYPGQQIKDIETQYSNVSFEEIKDAFAAFVEKVGIQDFPPKGSPACNVACSTINVLRGRTSHLKSNDEALTSKLTEVVFHTVVAMLRAGAGSTHCEMIKELFSFQRTGINIETYAQTLGQQELSFAMVAAKVDFTYKPNDYCSEKQHAAIQNDMLKKFILIFSPEQMKLVQREFLDLYRHYHSQLPGLSGDHIREMQYVVRDMADKYEQKNPYLHLKDPEVMKSHLAVVQNAVCSESYNSNLDDAICRMLEKIFEATIADDLVPDMIDCLMQVLLEIVNNEHARKQWEKVIIKYRSCFFSNIPDDKLSEVIYRRSLNTMRKLLVAEGEITRPEFDLVEGVLKKVLLKTKKMLPEDVKLALMLVQDMLLSGRKLLIEMSGKILEALQKSKSLDWKQHIAEAGDILMAISDVPFDRIQNDNNSWRFRTCSEYRSFLDKYMKMLKKGKIIHQLQSQLVHVYFTCLSEGSEEKAEIAYECSDDENMDFSKAPELRLEVLQKIPVVLENKALPWNSWKVYRGIENIMKSVIASFESGGIPNEDNDLLMAIFKQCSEGEDSIEEHWFQEEDEDSPNVNLEIWRVLASYAGVCEELNASLNLEPIMSEVFRWGKVAADEEHKELKRVIFDILHYLSHHPPVEFKRYLPDVIDLMLKTQYCRVLDTIVTKLYPHDPGAVHSKLQDIFDNLEDMKEDERSYLLIIINEIAQVHPEVFTHNQIQIILDWYQKATSQHEKNIIVIFFKHVSEKHPKSLVDFFPQMCDDSIFEPATLNFRCNTIACIGQVHKKLGQQAIDYLMKYIDYSDGMITLYVAAVLNSMIRKYTDYMQKYKTKLEKVENTGKLPQVKDLAHDMILVLEGKSVEQIAEDVQQQQEDIADLDEKVDVTIDTVVAIGDKVIEHDKEIGELEEGLEKIEERVDDVEEDMGEAKIKIEEIDNKTMTNAPKWSRDLTKLMNPEAENDWRLLASRLGYNNDDIRGWATQHDPCMALLSEWYATHKTSEASHAILTALTEMNRMDGAAIVENAMKQAEGVVEDEEFEYKSPPPVFISYQWGFQNEVKLLKHHLNMAGYECWMDVGQMGGGDKLFAKIDNGIRGAKVVICCVTDKYAQSPNCNREVNLSVNLNKPIIPLLMEKMDWPPKGSMGPIFSEYLFIRFFQRGGEETPQKDERYWPIPKFQELLMQLNFFVVPDQKMVQKEYARWWTPMTEDIVIDKNRGKKQSVAQKQQHNDSKGIKPGDNPLVFLSYQWGKQPQVKALYQRLTSLGYTVWMDIYQMGGGDSLYDKIDRGMRGCKAVVTCVTQKYSLSANCRREISLADALKKPIIPLLLEQMKWPPDGPMSMVFTELLYINFYRDETVQMTWQGEQFDELKGKLRLFVPGIASSTENDNRNQTSREDQNKTMTAVTAGDEAEVAISQERKDKNQRPRENQGKDIKPVSTVKKTTESVATANRKPTTTNKTDDKIKSEPDIKEENKSGDNKQTPVKKRAPVSQVVVAKAVSVNAFNKDKGSKQDTSANGNSAANKKPDSNSLTKFKKTGPNSGLASDGKTDNNNGKQRRNPASVQSEAILKAPSKDKLYSDSVAKEKGNGNIVKHGREPEDVQPNQIQTGNDQKKSSTCNIL